MNPSARAYTYVLIGLVSCSLLMYEVLLTRICALRLLWGVPFAYGIRLLNQRNPAIIPWAWAVNGCFSVMGSILAVVVSMTLGFAFTLALGAAIYFAAFAALVLRPDPSHPGLPVGSAPTSP